MTASDIRAVQNRNRQANATGPGYPTVRVCYSPDVYTCQAGRLVLRSAARQQEQQQAQLQPSFGLGAPSAAVVRAQLPLALQKSYRGRLAKPSRLFEGKFNLVEHDDAAQLQQPMMRQAPSANVSSDATKMLSAVESAMLAVMKEDANRYIEAVARQSSAGRGQRGQSGMLGQGRPMSSLRQRKSW
jgi:hypothetical protein